MLALDTAPTSHAVRVLGVLERIGDPLAQPALLQALADSRDEVAVAAAAALGVLLTSDRTTAATAALDHLTAAALAFSRPRAVRLAALEAMTASGLEIVASVRAQLLSDGDEAVRAAAQAPPGGLEAPDADMGPPDAGHPSPDAIVQAAAAGTLPLEAETLRQALSASAAVALSDLHRVVQCLVAHERAHPEEAAAWRVARAAAHQALAARHSRLAVYDLRDTIVQAGAATPVGFLSALQVVGDAASLDAIVEAWTATDDSWFKGQLSAVFAAIVQREGLTRRHGVMRRLAQRMPGAVHALWPKGQ